MARPATRAVVFFLALIASLYGVNRWGLALKQQASDSWLEKASVETQKITDTSLYWMSLFHAQLRGLATLFYGSQIITEEEFLNALELAEGVEVEAVIPLTTLAYAEADNSGNEISPRYSVLYSTDIGGVVARGANLNLQPATGAVVKSALRHPEKAVVGPMFFDEYGKRQITLAITAPNSGRQGVLLSVVNLSNFIEDLKTLHIPQGLNLRMMERDAEGAGQTGPLKAQNRVIIGSRYAAAETVDTFYYPTRSGNAHWDYYWDVQPGYLGGADTTLGSVVQLGGSALVLAVFAIIGFLARQNSRVNQLVRIRTRELAEASQAAEQANQAKSDFLANMSHEIRTPMNAVVGMGHLLARTPMNDHQQELLGNMQNGARNLLAIIDDILDVSKIEAGKMVLEKAPFNLEQVLEQLSGLLGARADEKGLEILFDVSPLIPVELEGDALRLNQVLVNLVGNAIKFTENGSVVIAVQPQFQTSGSDVCLRFLVRDTGIGMRPEQVENIFKAFSQADSSTTRRYGGTGLGLHISKQLVELMGGTLKVESELGIGSQFSFSASFVQRNPASQPDRLPEVAQGNRVLVVDDNEISRMILRTYLESFGLEVTTVSSGIAALHELNKVSEHPVEQRYRMVFMDWKMPEMDGIEAATHIKDDPRLMHNVTIVMVTAFAREEVLRRASQIGLEAVLTKPVNRSHLFDVVNGMLVDGSSLLPRPAEALVPDLQSPVRAGARVLVVEDNAINQYVARSLLEAMGLDVSIAGNGREALDAVAASDYDIVLMDLQMPEMDGYEATRQLRRTISDTELPIIAMTAHVMEQERQKCLDIGMNDHVSKPVDPQKLRRVLSRWLPADTGVGAANEPPVSGVVADDELPAIDGIDTRAGIDRLEGNSQIYRRVLENFYQEWRGRMEDIRRSLDTGDSESLQIQVHTLKGLVPVIAAPELLVTVLELDRLLHPDSEGEGFDGAAAAVDTTDGHFQALVIRLIEQLATVIHGLAVLFDTQQQSGCADVLLSEINRDELRLHLSTLRSHLKSGSLDAESSLMQIKPLVEGVNLAQWQHLVSAVETLEYPQALEHLDALNEVLEIGEAG